MIGKKKLKEIQKLSVQYEVLTEQFPKDYIGLEVWYKSPREMWADSAIEMDYALNELEMRLKEKILAILSN